jgi:hypothetical protein
MTATRKALMAFAFVTMLPSCYCGQAAHQQEPACVIRQQVIDCTKGATGEVLPAVFAVLRTLIEGSTNIDWTALMNRVESSGFKDAGCILAALEYDATPKRAATPESVARAEHAATAFNEWKARKGVAGVKFKLLVDGKEVYR